MINSIQVLNDGSSSSFPWLEIILAFIAIVIPSASFIFNVRISRLQRQKSERDEIYKKLNDFYGPIRLLLRNSKELYDLFRTSISNNHDVQGNFRTLTYILKGGRFEKTEASLINRIIDIGRNMEFIIEKNAGLIDSDELHNEMVILSTHIRIIRMALEGKFDKGDEAIKLFAERTFPNEIVDRVDTTFKQLKDRLNVLNSNKLL